MRITMKMSMIARTNKSFNEFAEDSRLASPREVLAATVSDTSRDWDNLRAPAALALKVQLGGARGQCRR